MTEPSPATPRQAIFLSYASQDVEAARHISESLRAVGVEVWIDKAGGLEHGDEWDAKIRRQIRECVLFIPLISASTQARHEGYFRIEWELAAERAQGIAQGVPFILPVIIDDTPEGEALVPDRFRRVHWTFLQEGRMTAEIQAQFLKLWTRRTAAPREEARRISSVNTASGLPTLPAPRRSKRLRWFALAAAIGAVLFASIWWFGREPAKGGKRTVSDPEEHVGISREAKRKAIESKSLVVLPLENLSPDPADAFFTEGLHSEIIATLSRVSELKVISRNSAQKYKNSTESLAAIAQKLAVANVITGDVRRDQDNIRVQLELRRASDEALLWSPPPFNRKVADVFAIQSEIASEVARVLQARQATGTAESARLFTTNARALELFLKAKEALYVPNTTYAQRRECILQLEEALKLDPEFWYAAGYLSVAHSQMLFVQRQNPDRAADRVAAKRWADEAIRLAPAGLGGGALAYYYIFVEEDPVRGLAIAEENVRALPGDAERHNLVAYALETLGRSREALVEVRLALELDPFNTSSRYTELKLLLQLRRGTEWNELLEQFLTDFPVMKGRELIESLGYRMHGKLPPSLDQYSPERRVFWLMRARRYDDAVKAAEAYLAAASGSDLTRFEVQWAHARALGQLGRKSQQAAAAQASLALAQKLEAEKVDPRRDAYRLALAYAVCGRADEAIAAAVRYAQDAATKSNVRLRWEREEELARIYAITGRIRESVERVKSLVQLPTGLLVASMAVDPDWDNVRSDPRFKSLLANPNNSKPIY